MVEYVLLLMIAVALALLLVRGMVGRDPQGSLIQAWAGLVDFIRTDKADDTQ